MVRQECLISKVKADIEQDDVRKICSILKAKREELNISQRKLSELTSLSPTGIRHIESLETSPTLFSLLKIAKALDIKLSDLLIAQSR